MSILIKYEWELVGLRFMMMVVTIICDRGDRYLSTMLFRAACAKCPP
ncbi:MAG: hypothetical protein IMZ61_12700 [Planctomycetes bacterium]|nr:hypothetical protein [Planctomycetota bacterium]